MFFFSKIQGNHNLQVAMFDRCFYCIRIPEKGKPRLAGDAQGPLFRFVFQRTSGSKGGGVLKFWEDHEGPQLKLSS